MNSLSNEKGDNVQQWVNSDVETLSLFMFISDVGCLPAINKILSCKKRKSVSKLSTEHAVTSFTNISAKHDSKRSWLLLGSNWCCDIMNTHSWIPPWISCGFHYFISLKCVGANLTHSYGALVISRCSQSDLSITSLITFQWTCQFILWSWFTEI